MGDFIGSPCDESTKKLAAGVGGMAKDTIKMTKADMLIEGFKIAWESGKVEKFALDIGWEEQLTVYDIYGKTGGAGINGGNKQAKVVTEALMQIIQEEIWRSPQGPTLITGDFNAIPNTLEIVREIMEQDHWTDVGSKAHWWGGTPDETTCQCRLNASPSRTDGILANLEAMIMIHKFYVTKDKNNGIH